MSTNTTQRLESDGTTKTELHAQWEAFEFRVPCEGRVRVENVSYGDESNEHVYVVEGVEAVGAIQCTCPADKYRSEACKHRHAVENQPAVMQVTTASTEERERMWARGRDRDEEGR